MANPCETLTRIIEKSGLHALANRDRMTMYSCAQLRQPSNETDWVYGIMHVWNFQLGAAAPGASEEREWTLRDLELALGKQLLVEFPIESQLQVHEYAIDDRQSWRISNATTTPFHQLSIKPSGHLDGEVDRRDTQIGLREANGTIYAYFKGKACSFELLRRSWVSLSSQDTTVGLGQTDRHVPFRISVDQNPLLNFYTLHLGISLQNISSER